MSRRLTSRGFVVFDEGIPARAGTVRVQESSLAGEGAHAWLFLDGAPQPPEPSAPQLSVESAERLIAALQAFVDDAKAGRLTEPAKVGAP